MGYWTSKVLPKIKKVFDKNGTKKAAAAEACKTFDDSKDEYAKEFEEKKSELQPKVVKIYKASSAEIKALIKEPKDAGLKKYSTAVQKFLDELVKIEFPGSKAVSEACSNLGPTLVPGPIFFVFEKVSTFMVTEEKAVELEAPAMTAPATEETSSTKGKEIVVEEGGGEEKNEEDRGAVVEAEKSTTELAAAAAEPSPEPPKP